MTRRALIASLLLCISIGGFGSAVAQDDRPALSASEDDVQISIANRLRLHPNAVNVMFNGNIVSVKITVPGAKRHRQEYANDASVIEVAVLKEIVNKQSYNTIHTIDVQFVLQKGASRPTVLRTIDFRRNAHGMFEKHSS